MLYNCKCVNYAKKIIQFITIDRLFSTPLLYIIVTFKASAIESGVTTQTLVLVCDRFLARNLG